MKRYNELSTHELTQLSNEEIEKYIKIECAYNGVRMLPDPPVAPEKPLVKQDKTMYEIFHNIFTESMEEAIRIHEVLSSCKLYYIEGSWDTSNLVIPEEPISKDSYYYPNMNTIVVFSRDSYEANKEALKEYNEKKSEYEKLKEQYDEIYDEYSKIRKEVLDKINEARKTVDKMAMYSRTYSEYLELAGGIPDIAVNFLLKAYPNIEEEFPDLLEYLAPDYKSKIRDV